MGLWACSGVSGYVFILVCSFSLIFHRGRRQCTTLHTILDTMRLHVSCVGWGTHEPSGLTTGGALHVHEALHERVSLLAITTTIRCAIDAIEEMIQLIFQEYCPLLE